MLLFVPVSDAKTTWLIVWFCSKGDDWGGIGSVSLAGYITHVVPAAHQGTPYHQATVIAGTPDCRNLSHTPYTSSEFVQVEFHQRQGQRGHDITHIEEFPALGHRDGTNHVNSQPHMELAHGRWGMPGAPTVRMDQGDPFHPCSGTEAEHQTTLTVRPADGTCLDSYETPVRP